jgi:hypothetical protein
MKDSLPPLSIFQCTIEALILGLIEVYGEMKVRSAVDKCLQPKQ